MQKLEYEVVKNARAKEQKSLEILEQKSSELMATVLKLPPPEPKKPIEKLIFVSDRDRVMYFRDQEKQTALKRFEAEAKVIRDEARQ